MAKGTISGGACGFTTVVICRQGEGRKIRIDLDTSCPNVQKIAEELQEIDPFSEVFKRLQETLLCQLASKHCPHPSCLVPVGVLKTIEVEAGLALPKDAGISLEK